MKKEQVLLHAELEGDSRRRLAEVTLADLELTEVVLEASQSEREALLEPSAHNQSIKSVKMTNCVTVVSMEFEKRHFQVQNFTVEKKDTEFMTDYN